MAEKNLRAGGCCSVTKRNLHHSFGICFVAPFTSVVQKNQRTSLKDKKPLLLSRQDSDNKHQDKWYPDLQGKLSGERIWLTPSPEVLKTAFDRGIIGSAPSVGGASWMSGTSQSGGWRLALESLVLRRIVDATSLARRGGGAVSGSFRVIRELFSADRDMTMPVVLMTSTGASQRSVEQMCRKRIWLSALELFSEGSLWGKNSNPGVPGCIHANGVMTDTEIGLAFGRDSVVHAIVTSEGLLPRLAGDIARLQALRRIG